MGSNAGQVADCVILTSMKKAHSTHVAIIGLGRWGRVLLTEARQTFTVDTIVHKSADATAEYVAEHAPDIPCTTSLEEVLENNTIEAVIIATPPHTHVELSKAALQAGKHVFVEKPLSDSVEEV